MSDERAFRGVWIPAEIWLNRELSLQEKVMLIEIDSLQHPQKGCFKSNKKLISLRYCPFVVQLQLGPSYHSMSDVVEVEKTRFPPGPYRTSTA